MKHVALLLSICSLASAADFMTGQAARLTIGQVNFTAQDSGSPSAAQLGAVSGLAYFKNMLFVADSNRVQADPVQNRVLIYNNVSGFVIPPNQEVPQGVRCPLCGGTADVALGQPDFTSTGISLPPTQTSMRTPTGVASDGQFLVVADTDNNRVLIWKTIPRTVGAPADVVLGQPDFKTVKIKLDASSMRGPQGVWIQGTRLFVADTQNHRVLVWNNIPATNGQAADYVLGEPNLSTAPSPATFDIKPTANDLAYPVSVTSDGQRLFVTDLGHDRVLIWNSIPTQNGQAADVVIGQPDMTSEGANNVTALCASNGTDSNNKPTYPIRCANTLDSPRFALSDGTRLFLADGGNDRILIYNSIPAQNGQRADTILGQNDEFSDLVTDSLDTFNPDSNILRSSPNTVRTPMSLAFDGANLYVSDPFDRRVLVFTVGELSVPVNGIGNAASRAVFAIGAISFGGTITANDTVTVTVQSTPYKYTIVKDDTLATVIGHLTDLINGRAGGGAADPNVFARSNPAFNEMLLVSKVSGTAGGATTYSVTLSTSATITATTSGAFLGGGQNAAEVAPGTIVQIVGDNLSDATASGQPDSQGFYPTTLAGTQVYFDGIKAPLVFVSPTQINAQIPFSVGDASGISAYVRTQHKNGTTSNTAAVSVPIVGQNPGIFAQDVGGDPRPAVAFHASSFAIAVVSVDGTIAANNVATITIAGVAYNYTVQASDSLASVRDALIGLINADTNAPVTASAAGQFTRIILTAKAPGPEGNGITVAGSASASAVVTISALQANTCCASAAGTPITADNPAMAGELISVFATGLGTVQPDDANAAATTGLVYSGPPNSPVVAVDDAQAGGSTANVLQAGLKPGMLGVYEVQLQLSASIPTNPNTQLFIAQNVFTSNIVTIPVVNPNPPQ